jgi:hypothetical protein
MARAAMEITKSGISKISKKGLVIAGAMNIMYNTKRMKIKGRRIPLIFRSGYVLILYSFFAITYHLGTGILLFPPGKKFLFLDTTCE